MQAKLEPSRVISANYSQINSFEDLIVWQKAHQLMIKVYETAKLLPLEEKYNRKSQITRSASSISANIAEGYGRFHFQENVQFCRQARGSLAETKNHIMAARDLGQLPLEACEELLKMCDDIYRLLNAYITKTLSWQKDSNKQGKIKK